MSSTWNLLKFVSLPILAIVCLFSYACYCAWEEVRINDLIVESSLKGNHNAIEILRKYEKPWKLDQRIVNAALDGNEFALQVLGIPLEKDPSSKFNYESGDYQKTTREIL